MTKKIKRESTSNTIDFEVGEFVTSGTKIGQIIDKKPGALMQFLIQWQHRFNLIPMWESGRHLLREPYLRNLSVPENIIIFGHPTIPNKELKMLKRFCGLGRIETENYEMVEHTCFRKVSLFDLFGELTETQEDLLSFNYHALKVFEVIKKSEVASYSEIKLATKKSIFQAATVEICLEELQEVGLISFNSKKKVYYVNK